MVGNEHGYLTSGLLVDSMFLCACTCAGNLLHEKAFVGKKNFLPPRITCITIFRLTILFLIQDSGLARKSDHLCISRGGGKQSSPKDFYVGDHIFAVLPHFARWEAQQTLTVQRQHGNPLANHCSQLSLSLSLCTINSCICLPWIHPKSLGRRAFFFGCEHSKRLSSYRDREFLCVCRKRLWILRQDRTSKGTPCLLKFLLIGGAGPASTTSMAAWELLSSY